MNELITRWLNGLRNYTAGALLYRQFGNDDQKKQLLATGKTKLTEEALLKAMQQLVMQKELPVKQAEVINFMQPMPEAKDKVLNALRSEWMPFYTEMNLKRHRLWELIDDESKEALVKRATLANEILKLEQQCIAVWSKRKHYSDHGNLPGRTKKQQDIIVDPVSAKLQIIKVQSYIRSYKSKLNKAPGNANFAAKLKQYEAELKSLKKQHG